MIRSHLSSGVVEILWIEDNPADRLLIKEFFDWGSKPCHMTFAKDGEEALALLFNEPQPGEILQLPDLIIVDLNLPRIDGREVITQIKTNEATKDIPVVVFTSASGAEEISNCYHQHISGFLTKPFDLDDYRDTLKSIREYWVNHVVLPHTRYRSHGPSFDKLGERRA